MTREQFRAEKLYYISLSVTKSMLEKGVIDEEVSAIIATRLLEKYRPVSGILLAGKERFYGENKQDRAENPCP